MKILSNKKECARMHLKNAKFLTAPSRVFRAVGCATLTFVFTASLSQCKDILECHEGDVKCQDNVIVECVLNQASLPIYDWTDRLDCSEFGGICQSGDEYPDYKGHACTFPVIKCVDQTTEVCVAQGIAGCTDTPDMATLLEDCSSENYCVEDDSGASVCAYLPDACTDGETTCLSDSALLYCVDSVWKEKDTCSSPMTCIDTGEQALCVYDTEPCEPDGVQQCAGDSLWTCRGGYWTVGEILCSGDQDTAMNTFCKEKDDGTFICVYNTDACEDGDEKCVSDFRSLVLSCVDGCWTDVETCADGYECVQTTDTKIGCDPHR